MTMSKFLAGSSAALSGAAIIGSILIYARMHTEPAAPAAQPVFVASKTGTMHIEPPQPLTEADMLKCNRRTKVYREPQVEPEKEAPKISDSFPLLPDLKVGQSGYIVYLVSIGGKVYAPDLAAVSPTSQRVDGNSYEIHVVRLANGISVDCATRAFIIPRDDLDSDCIPVVEMFSTKK